MSIDINQQNYETQVGTTLTFTNQTASVPTYTEQVGTTITYDKILKIDGSLYGYENYGEQSYAGRPFVLGKQE